MERLPEPWGGVDEAVFGPLPLETIQAELMQHWRDAVKALTRYSPPTHTVTCWPSQRDLNRILLTSRYITSPAPCGPDCEIAMTTERVP